MYILERQARNKFLVCFVLQKRFRQLHAQVRIVSYPRSEYEIKQYMFDLYRQACIQTSSSKYMFKLALNK